MSCAAKPKFQGHANATQNRLPSSKTWQLQVAKAQFSEVFRRARERAPQVVTRQGKKAVVIPAWKDRGHDRPRPLRLHPAGQEFDSHRASCLRLTAWWADSTLNAKFCYQVFVRRQQQFPATSFLRCGQVDELTASVATITGGQHRIRGLALLFSKPSLEGSFESIVSFAIAHSRDTGIRTKQHRCSIQNPNTPDTGCPSFRDC